jgi:hypothetical protein
VIAIYRQFSNAPPFLYGTSLDYIFWSVAGTTFTIQNSITYGLATINGAPNIVSRGTQGNLLPLLPFRLPPVFVSRFLSGLIIPPLL